VTGRAGRALAWAALVVGAAATPACAPSRVPDPADAARAYASAVARGDTAMVYGMLTRASREQRSKGELEAMLADERAELAEQGKALSGPDVRVDATAILRFADGEQAALELEDGRYAVSVAGALPGGARTPEGALDQLRRVLARRSYAGLMRVLSATTRAAIESDLRTLVDGLTSPETLPVKVGGDTAVVEVPGGHQVKLRREGGIWRVDDFD
jgi:hypothetical protein